MPGKITANTSTDFRKFVNFANKALSSTGENTVARLKGAPQNDYKGLFASFWRTSAMKTANNQVRDLFLKTVADMFGGEKFIPDVVRKNMKLDSFGKGKPLTARRINNVIAAIESLGSGKFTEPGSVAEAKAMGYSDAELPKLARIATLYQQATGCTDGEAEAAALDAKSNASRLFKTGGRFTLNAENFKAGLKLMEKFPAWCSETRNAYKNKAPNASLSALNGSESAFCSECKSSGLQKFIFDEIARNDAIDLNAKNPEDVFGVKNNPASRYVLSGRISGMGSTLAQIPQEKRALFYEVDSLFHPLSDKHGSPKQIEQNTIFASRILKNYEALAALKAQGRLTREAAFDVLYPDIADKGNKDAKAVNAFEDVVMARIMAEFNGSVAEIGPVFSMLGASGATLDEVIQAMKENRDLPMAPHRANVALELENIGDLGNGGINSMRGDIYRPSLPISKADGSKFPGVENKFVFHFADETIESPHQSADNAAPVMDKISDKLRALCNDAHPEQLDALGITLGQGSLSCLKGGLDKFGIVSNEHMAVEYDISRNEKTGSITVKISNPKNLPVKFNWTTTIDVNGNSSTSPMRIDHGQFEEKAMVKVKYLKDVVPEKTEEAATALVKNVLEMCGDDFEVKDIVAKNIYNVCVNGASKLRTQEQIKEKIDAIRANFAEIRKAADGNAAIENAGRIFMDGLAGKSVKPGLVGQLIKVAGEMSTGSFSTLNDSSTPAQIMKGVIDIRDAVNELMNDTKIGDYLEGADELSAARDMVAMLALAKIPSARLASISAALSSEKANMAVAILDDFIDGKYPVPKASLTAAQKDAIDTQSYNLRGMIAQYDLAVKEVIGKTANGIEAYKGAFDKKAAGLDKFFKSILECADKSIAEKADLARQSQNIESNYAGAKANAANAYSKAGAGNEKKVDELILAALHRTAANDDAVKIAASNIDAILVGSDAQLRSITDVRKHADAIAANFKELETLAKGNPAVYEAGKAMMAAMGGKALPAGMIAKLVAAANDASLDAIRKLGRKSSSLAIHRAVTQFRDNLTRAMASSGAETAAAGLDEKQACRNFVAFLMLKRCGDKAVAAIDGALAGEKAGKMLAFYSAVSKGEYNDDLGHEAAARLENQAASHMTHIVVLRDIASRAHGNAGGSKLVPFGGAMNVDEISGPAILDDLINMA